MRARSVIPLFLVFLLDRIVAFPHDILDPFPTLATQSAQDDIVDAEDFWRAGQVDDGQGWISRWLSMGGEGVVAVDLPDGSNITVPHRPAAFPTALSPPLSLPISGLLVPFSTLALPGPSHQSSSSPFESACVPAVFPPPRPNVPSGIFKLALIERGGCDFARKIRAAQDRGAAGVVVGDGILRIGETDEEGRTRENLITMYTPEDTESLFIPAVFVSRASYLMLRDLLANHTDSGRSDAEGLWIDLSEGNDEGGSLLSFALLMPSIFLLATIAVHRVRVARRKEADRAPPLVVLSLPERIWTPDIVWEKEESASSSESTPESPASPTSQISPSPSPSRPFQPAASPTPLLSSGILEASDPVQSTSQLPIANKSPHHRKKARTKSKQQYFSKDECAICMEMFEKGDVVRILPCGHVFHKEECDEWLLKWRKLCPTCRADVTLPALHSGGPITPVIDPTAVEEEIPLRSRIESLSARVRNWVPTWMSRRRGSGEREPLIPNEEV